VASSNRDIRRIDINADVGEGAIDDALFLLVTSANIACGGHAGDDDSMARAAGLAIANGVAIGAHPGYPDRARFGRASMSLPHAALASEVGRQIARLTRVAGTLGARLVHVKPHGALYNDAAGDDAVARAIAASVAGVSGDLVLVGLAGSRALEVWRGLGLPVAAEGFADRAYRTDGTLIPRGTAGALIVDPATAAAQAVSLARSGRIDTICVHSDTPGASEIASAVVAALAADGFVPAPLSLRRTGT